MADLKLLIEKYPTAEWFKDGSTVPVQLGKLDALVQYKNLTSCPICHGKIKRARVSTACLHRFCAECIERWLRDELSVAGVASAFCPVCRAVIKSRRDFKPDANFDQLMRGLYGDVEAFERQEEEVAAAANAPFLEQWQQQMGRLQEVAARQAAAAAAGARRGPRPRGGGRARGRLTGGDTGGALASLEVAGAANGSGGSREGTPYYYGYDGAAEYYQYDSRGPSAGPSRRTSAGGELFAPGGGGGGGESETSGPPLAWGVKRQRTQVPVGHGRPVGGGSATAGPSSGYRGYATGRAQLYNLNSHLGELEEHGGGSGGYAGVSAQQQYQQFPPSYYPMDYDGELAYEEERRGWDRQPTAKELRQEAGQLLAAGAARAHLERLRAAQLVPVHLVPMSDGAAAAGTPQLRRPFLLCPPDTTVAVLQAHVLFKIQQQQKQQQQQPAAAAAEASAAGASNPAPSAAAASSEVPGGMRSAVNLYPPDGTLPTGGGSSALLMPGGCRRNPAAPLPSNATVKQLFLEQTDPRHDLVLRYAVSSAPSASS